MLASGTRVGVMAGLVLATLSLAACGSAPDQKTASDTRPDVRIARVDSDNQAAVIKAVGTVALRREASLGFTSAGRVEKILVQEGDVIRSGQMIAALDTTAVAADVARIEAERVRAAAEFKRSSALLEQGWVTRPRVENAEAALRAANAQLSAARFQASAARIVAPGPGTVLARLVEPGQVIAAGTPVVIVGDMASGFVLRVPLSDRDAARVTEGAAATVRLAALGDAVLAGRVIEIAGRADRATGTFTVEVSLPSDARLKSGMIGTVEITAGGPVDTRLTVPSAGIFAARAGSAFVNIVDPASGKVSLRQVSIAETADGAITVTGGVQRGEWVAVTRVDKLRDGMTVRPLRTTATASAADSQATRP